VFLLSGLWHGAALHFVAWGGFHGIAYWTEEQLRRHIPLPAWGSEGARALLQKSGQRVLTFGVVTLGWVFFRLSDISNIRVTLERMLFVNLEIPYTALNPILTRPDSRWFILILLSAIILDSSRAFRSALDRVPESSRHVVGELAYVNWFFVTLVLLGDLGVRDFTYFGF
jgi:D-alanyl-lipoteichoic acid acyltransferase DltB (MBOAT superfamily)